MLGIIKIFLNIPKWSFLSIYYCLSSGTIAEKSDDIFIEKFKKFGQKWFWPQKMSNLPHSGLSKNFHENSKQSLSTTF